MGCLVKAVIDSDILIDYLQGLEKAKQEIDRYSEPQISIISWMEILTDAETLEEEKQCKEFLSQFTIHQLSPQIAEEAVHVRKQFRIRLPDAIVWATARVSGCILVSRNSKDFPIKEPGVRIPYTVP